MDHQLFEYLQSFLTERRKHLFKQVLAERTRHVTVVTEGVYQLHNTSAVVRSCDVFGIQDLHVVEEFKGRRVDKEIAMGAQKWVNVHRYGTITDCIATLRKQGYRIIATTPHNESGLLQDFDLKQKSALFFGKESDGLSEEVLKQADGFLKIPMYGFTESLNISVSAAIILHDLVNRMRRSDINWQLSPTEKEVLEFEWTRRSIKNVGDIERHYYEQKKS